MGISEGEGKDIQIKFLFIKRLPEGIEIYKINSESTADEFYDSTGIKYDKLLANNVPINKDYVFKEGDEIIGLRTKLPGSAYDLLDLIINEQKFLKNKLKEFEGNKYIKNSIKKTINYSSNIEKRMTILDNYFYLEGIKNKYIEISNSIVFVDILNEKHLKRLPLEQCYERHVIQSDETLEALDNILMEYWEILRK